MLTSGPAALVCAISGDGMRAVVRVGRRGARRLELFDLRSGRCTELLPGGEANVADARFGITGGQLFVHSDAGASGPRCWPSGSTATPSRRCRTSSPAATTHDLDLVALDPAGARAALVWNVDGRSEVDLLDLRSGITEPLPRPPGDVVTGAAFTRDGRALLVGNEGPTVPPTITRIASARPTADAIPVTPLLPAAPRDAGHLVDPVLHHFPGEDGLPLSGWLFRPDERLRRRTRPSSGCTAARRPRNARSSSRCSRRCSPRASRSSRRTSAARAGTAARSPRPTTWNGGSSRSRTCAPPSTSLVEHGLADPARIGVSGRSYGGYLTLVALAWFPELFRVGVDVCGISDFTTFYEQTEPWIAAAAVTKYGDPEARRRAAA